EEEVGVPRECVELIGRLDDVITRTGFLVAPFVGVVETRIEYVLQPSEVVEVFEVPLEALLDESQPEIRYMTYRDSVYPVYFYCHDGVEIWGLTARMLKSCLDLVRLAV
ncbi:MAG TPA: CoA pyrophosphatase, partial [Thermoanaerobaculia bacterium]